MKRRLFPLLPLLVLPAAALLAQAPGGARTQIVRVAKPARQTIAQSLVKTGEIISPSVVDVSTKVGGRLEAMALEDGTRVEEGTAVKRGQLIACIQDADYAAKVRAAVASLDAAKATLRDAERELRRTEMLFRDGTATERELDGATAAFERAKAAVSQCTAERDLTEIDLRETKIYAPVDGVVSARCAEPGALVQAGTKLATVTEIDSLRFQMNVPTTLYALLALDVGVEIEVDAYPGEKIPAKITRMYPVADSATRTVRVEAAVDNRERRYVPGMYAVGTVALNRRENVLVLPYEAVVRNVDHSFVYVVKDGVAVLTRVTPGIRSDAVVEIAEGLEGGEDVVVAGQHRLADGTPVRPETADEKVREILR